MGSSIEEWENFARSRAQWQIVQRKDTNDDDGKTTFSIICMRIRELSWIENEMKHLPQLPAVRPRNSPVSPFHRNILKLSQPDSFGGGV